MDASSNRGAPVPVLPIVAPEGSLPCTLAGVADAVWRAVERGCADRWTPWGLPTLATRGPDGDPQARVVALRGVDRDERMLWFHSDRRSAKVCALAADPRASVLFWSAADAVEVRMTGSIALHAGGPHADRAWAEASSLSRNAAQIALAPGTPLTRSMAFELLVQEGDAATARAHFVALAFVADTIDWLWLGPRDLRRARLAWIGHDWLGHWIVP